MSVPDSVFIPDGYGLAVYRMQNEGAGEQYSVTMGYKQSDVGTPTANADALAHFNSWVTAGSLFDTADVNEEWSFLGVTVYRRDAPAGPIVGGEHLETRTGANGPQTEPVNSLITYVMQKRTGNIGRAYRGRCYLPFDHGEAAAGVNFSGIINGSYLALQAARVDQWFIELTDANLLPALLHTTPLVGTRPPPTLITSFALSNLAGRQRRRWSH